MPTYRQILYQIVFGTKYRNNTLKYSHQKEMYKYIWGIFKNKKCFLYKIGGTENHIHLISDLHPSIPLADLIKDIKLATSEWIKEKGIYRNFDGWQDGYGAFTYSIKEKMSLIKYVENQKEHHKKETFEEEFKRLLEEHGIEFDERYLF